MMKKKSRRRSGKKKVILVPYAAQGHVTPMVKLGAALIPFGYNPVLIIPDYIHYYQSTEEEEEDGDNNVSCLRIPDGLAADAPRDFFTIETAMENVMPIHLHRILLQHHHTITTDDHNDDDEVAFMVVDVLASWAIQVGNRCGIPTVGFWPAMLATYRLVFSIPDLLRSGIISMSGIPRKEDEGIVVGNEESLSSLLTTQDLPWLIGSVASRKARFGFWSRVVDRCGSLRWILVNSFPDHQQQQSLLINNNITYPIVVPVGPLGMVAAAASTSSVTSRPSFWQEDRSCLDWLQHQKPNSVIYISFGSWVGPIGDESVNKLAWSLEATGLPFLWVLSSSWRGGLPQGFTQRVSDRGKVVSWAPQIEVLENQAVGCYLTHCGWNSTLEAVKYQKKLLCYPIAGDQFVNSKYIVDVWGIGVRLTGFGETEVGDAVVKVITDKDNIMAHRLRHLHDTTMGHTASLNLHQNLTLFIHHINTTKLTPH